MTDDKKDDLPVDTVFISKDLMTYVCLHKDIHKITKDNKISFWCRKCGNELVENKQEQVINV